MAESMLKIPRSQQCRDGFKSLEGFRGDPQGVNGDRTEPWSMPTLRNLEMRSKQ